MDDNTIDTQAGFSMCAGFTCESHERESRWVTQESGCCIKGHFTKRQITRVTLCEGEWGFCTPQQDMVMHHTPHFTRYASTVWDQSRFSLPEQLLRCDGPHCIAVDYDIMTIYKHLCYLLHMRSSKVLANRDKKRFPSAGVNTRHTVKATRPPSKVFFFFFFRLPVWCSSGWTAPSVSCLAAESCSFESRVASDGWHRVSGDVAARLLLKTQHKLPPPPNHL